jgi:Chlamydia polymorphic membrane protein (Chlamydia_PMP) repeat
MASPVLAQATLQRSVNSKSCILCESILALNCCSTCCPIQSPPAPSAEDDTPGKGGAIFAYYSTTVSINNSTFVHNTAEVQSADIVSSGSTLKGSQGGALFTQGVLTITDSHFSECTGTLSLLFVLVVAAVLPHGLHVCVLSNLIFVSMVLPLMQHTSTLPLAETHKQ